MRFMSCYLCGTPQITLYDFQAPPPRIMTRRIAELPSLRYGPIGAKSATSGPLKVSMYHSDTLPKSKKIAQAMDYKPVRPVSSTE